MGEYELTVGFPDQVRATWCMEEACMDNIDVAYYFGGDFDGTHQCYYNYMVWHDEEIGAWPVVYSQRGFAEVPFSKAQCMAIGSYRTLREAKDACEAHARARLERYPGAKSGSFS